MLEITYRTKLFEQSQQTFYANTMRNDGFYTVQTQEIVLKNKVEKQAIRGNRRIELLWKIRTGQFIQRDKCHSLIFIPGLPLWRVEEMEFSRAGVPKLSFTMYPFSISTNEHVP